MVDWPHSPVHRLGDAGCMIVTAGTYQKEHFFRGAIRLSLLQDSLLEAADQYGWRPQAWAVFSNHHHFMAMPSPEAKSLGILIKRLHAMTAIAVNKADRTPRRKVWFQYWDTRLTYEKSYLARLNYVMQNPVRHGLVTRAEDYPWCSASWFYRRADKSFAETVERLKIDRVNVFDEYHVLGE